MTSTAILKAAAGSTALYVLVTTPLFALWEVVQLPLYTIWREEGLGPSLTAALHCTTGDAVIASMSMLASLSIAARCARLRSFGGVTAAVVIFGVLATAALEIVSVRWLERWEYSSLMPVDPIFGIGLAPLAQWLVVPVISLWLIRRQIIRFVSATRGGMSWRVGE
ncbi:MAG TPA: hypothetical protein DDZ68_04560 [Parvularcula sp.]|jgi:hypothetical protein|nr:hypothetical protein [Parvularcula sp.]